MRPIRSVMAGVVSEAVPSKAAKCRRKFLRFFPRGFQDDKYFAWERGYKLAAHERWQQLLPKSEFKRLLAETDYSEVGTRALRSLAGTNLLFSFENMALRDALKTSVGAEAFATGLFDLLHGPGNLAKRFEGWCEVVAELPKKQSRVGTHPVTTVFGSIAQPEKHIFLKPMVTKRAAAEYGFKLHYETRPGWKTYSSVLDFAERIRSDIADMKPRDMIDIQSYIWVLGSDEYR